MYVYISERQIEMNWQIQSKHRHQPIRKLDRRNAIKNIDYDATSSPSSSSIVVPTSFRVEGIEGDFDLICRSLGLSGPEDFAIPAAAWEARKSPQNFNNRNSKSCELGSSNNSVSDDYGFEAKVNEKGNSKSCELVNNPKLEDFRDRENKGNEKGAECRNTRSCVLVNSRKKESSLNSVVGKLRFSENERSGKRFDSADLGFCEWPSNQNTEKVGVSGSGRVVSFGNVEDEIGVTENERNEIGTNSRFYDSANDRDQEKYRVNGSNSDYFLDTVENKARDGNERNRSGFARDQIGVRIRECDGVKCESAIDQNSVKTRVGSSNRNDLLNTFEDRVKMGNEGNKNELEIVVGDKNFHVVKCGLGNHQNKENSSRTFEPDVRIRESKRSEYDVGPANIDSRAKGAGEFRNCNNELIIDSGRVKNRISVRSFRNGIKGARPPLLAEIGVRVKQCNVVECELANNQNPEKSWVTSSNNNELFDILEDKVRSENKRNENVFSRAEIDVRVRACDEDEYELGNHLNLDRLGILDSKRAISSETFEPNIRVGERNSNENEFVLSKVDISARRTDESLRVRSFRGGIKGARPPLLAPPPVISPCQQTDNMGSSWDLLRSFGPSPHDEDSNSYVGNSIRENKMTIEPIPEDGKQRRDMHGEWLEDIKVVSESYSDTLEDKDDDFTYVKMEPLHFVSPLGKFKCTINSWQKGDFLGSGSFGTVYEGFTDDGIFFAVKEVSLLDQGDQGKQSIYQLEQEIFFLSQFEHENIVQYLGTDKDNGKLYIFLELVTKGSLASLYQKYNLQDSQVSAYTRQILNGLNYLHLRKVVHRDIKCANILVDASGFVKLADFGLAKATNLNDVKSCKGTAFWMAPEVVNRKNHGYGLAADIWSLGCTVLEMLTRRIPYSHLEGMQALFRIGKGEPPLVPNSLSREARDFISKCLRVNPDDRPTAAQLLNHPFVKRPLTTLSAPTSPFQHGRRS